MKVLLASLALLPVIASHMFLQLPPLSLSSSSTSHRMPLGLLQYSRQSPVTSMKDLHQRQQIKPEDESFPDVEAQESLSEEQSSYQRSLGQRKPQNSRIPTEDLGGDWSSLYQSSLEPRLEALPESKRSADYELAVRIPEGLDDALVSREDVASLAEPMSYLLPSPKRPSRPLSSYPFQFSTGHQRRSNTPMASRQMRFGDNLPEGVKKAPAKRYLGIELPDYIASNYGADKTSNTKLHNLKQRMRSVGK